MQNTHTKKCLFWFMWTVHWFSLSSLYGLRKGHAMLVALPYNSAFCKAFCCPFYSWVSLNAVCVCSLVYGMMCRLCQSNLLCQTYLGQTNAGYNLLCVKALCVWLCWNYSLFLRLTLFKIKTLSFLSSACNRKIKIFGMFPNTWVAEMWREGRNFSQYHLGQVS